jgi:hypothetical protein
MWDTAAGTRSILRFLSQLIGERYGGWVVGKGGGGTCRYWQRRPVHLLGTIHSFKHSLTHPLIHSHQHHTAIMSHIHSAQEFRHKYARYLSDKQFKLANVWQDRYLTYYRRYYRNLF